MIRIGLYSEDRTLRTLLSSALGGDFRILPEAGAEEIERLIAGRDCDVAILDLNSNLNLVQSRIEFSRRMIAANLPAVILADDELRATAFELVRVGAFGYCRRPPSFATSRLCSAGPMNRPRKTHTRRRGGKRRRIPPGAAA